MFPKLPNITPPQEQRQVFNIKKLTGRSPQKKYMGSLVKIELRPHDALGILSFLREYVNDSNKHDGNLAALHEMVNAYENQIYTNVSSKHLDDAELELSVNKITGRVPD